MKKRIWLAALVVLHLAAGSVLAAGKSSTEAGQEMFNDAELSGSANESSCSSCHAGGKGLENVASVKKLSRAINKCIIERMGGEKMDGRLVGMRSLKMYIESLQAD